eukprot:SAG31_NODE_20789_length_565_cov_1.072961_1_plen_167_part_01
MPAAGLENSESQPQATAKAAAIDGRELNPLGAEGQLTALVVLGDSSIAEKALSAFPPSSQLLSAAVKEMLTDLCKGDYVAVLSSGLARWLLEASDGSNDCDGQIELGANVETMKQQGNELFSKQEFSRACSVYSATIEAAESQIADNTGSVTLARACIDACKLNRAA